MPTVLSAIDACMKYLQIGNEIKPGLIHSHYFYRFRITECLLV